MSNSNNRKIVFASMLGAILATGLLALNPSTITNADAQMYANDYGYDNYYNNYYLEPKSSHTNIQKIKCVNSNINVNGVDITEVPKDNNALAAANEAGAEGTAEEANTENANGLADRINFQRNLVNICVNVNDNEQVKVTPPEEQTCEDCFSVLNEEQINRFFELALVSSIAQACQQLNGIVNNCEENDVVNQILQQLPGITAEQIDAILECLANNGVILPQSQCDSG